MRKSRSRSNPMKGWSPPRKVTSRRSMLKRCGKKCFLRVEHTKTGRSKPMFPVCNNNCTYSCKGLLAAKTRAKQWKYTHAAKKSQSLAKRKKCHWARRRLKFAMMKGEYVPSHC